MWEVNRHSGVLTVSFLCYSPSSLQDIHSSSTTVEEALWFSGRLRLPSTVSDAQVGSTQTNSCGTPVACGFLMMLWMAMCAGGSFQ